MEIRYALYREIEIISHNSREPLVLVDDFNDIRDPSKKKGGAPFNWHRANIFNERIVLT